MVEPKDEQTQPVGEGGGLPAEAAPEAAADAPQPAPGTPSGLPVPEPKIKATTMMAALRVLFVLGYLAAVLAFQLPWLWTTLVFVVVATAVECLSFRAPNAFFRKEWPGWYDPEAR